MKKIAQFFVRNALKNSPYFFYRFKKLKQFDNLDPVKKLELQNDAFIKLVKHAHKYSRFYQKLYNRHGVDIAQIKDLRDISLLPSINKAMVKSNVDDILITKKMFVKPAYTSGTSGSPLMVYRDYHSTVEEEAYLWRHRAIFGHQIGMKSVALRADLDRDTFVSVDPFSNTKYLSSYRLSDNTVDQYYKEIVDYAPNAIYAFPSSVEILANFLIDKKKTLHVPLIFTSSETLYDFQREKIQRVFNARIADWYGNAERSIALEENLSGTYNELPLYSINEYFDDYTLTTGLINKSFPLIRYEVNDIFVPDKDSGKVRNIIGRVDDAIELPDGTKVVRLGAVFKGLDEVSYAQIIQNDPKSLLVNVVPTALYDQTLTPQKILGKIKQLVGHELTIRVNPVDEKDIIKTSRGKYKLVINNLNASKKSSATSLS